MEEYRVSVAGQDVIVTRHGENDYDAYFMDEDFSIRGTFGEVLDNIISCEERAWEDGLMEIMQNLMKGVRHG